MAERKHPQIADAFRILGIIATCIVTFIAGLVLLLLSFCSGSPERPLFFVLAIFVVVMGIWIIVALARGILAPSVEK
ncbi:MAG TPA: hypothetical protein VKX46_21185 [Ktedonobacteraceae bacterium]|nr:hypothetical protein [Ktedonobacteraceae bacterium]